MSNDIVLVEPYFEILTPKAEILGMPAKIETACRVCYKSEDKTGEGSAKRIIEQVIKSGHESVLEHCVIITRIVGSRSMSHQLVRHRVGVGISQVSQRFVSYTGKKAEGGLRVVCPASVGNSSNQTEWLSFMRDMYGLYIKLRNQGIPAEDARSVLPNATQTELVFSANIREWRHIFELRALNLHAQDELRGLTLGIFHKLIEVVPVFFEDLKSKHPYDKVLAQTPVYKGDFV